MASMSFAREAVKEQALIYDVASSAGQADAGAAAAAIQRYSHKYVRAQAASQLFRADWIKEQMAAGLFRRCGIKPVGCKSHSSVVLMRDSCGILS